jgi:hypothetical protein
MAVAVAVAVVALAIMLAVVVVAPGQEVGKLRSPAVSADFTEPELLEKGIQAVGAAQESILQDKAALV